MIRTIFFLAFSILTLPGVIAQPSIGSGWVLPTQGFYPKGTNGKWVFLRSPEKPLYVWFNAANDQHKLTDGKTVYRGAANEFALGIGRVSGFVLYETDYKYAENRYWLTTPDFVYWKSIEWNSYGTPGVGGVYYAAKAGERDIYLSMWDKSSLSWKQVGEQWVIDTSKGRKNHPRTDQRIRGYSTLIRYGGSPQRNVPRTWMAHPDLSGPIYFPPSTQKDWAKYNIAGWGVGEIPFWSGVANGPWVWREDIILTPHSEAQFDDGRFDPPPTSSPLIDREIEPYIIPGRVSSPVGSTSR